MSYRVTPNIKCSVANTDVVTLSNESFLWIFYFILYFFTFDLYFNTFLHVLAAFYEHFSS